MDSCKVCQKVDRRRGLFIIFAIMSVVTFALAVLAGVCEKTGHICTLIHWLCSLCKTPFLGFSLEGLRNVAMTVGLTGILFAWLLQVIGDKECGVELDKLFQNQFRGYLLQMFLFIIAMIMCIYYSSVSPGCGKWGSSAVFTFITMMFCICNMWIMCTCFLFSTTTRRMIAFRYLEEQLKKRWNEWELGLWAKELDTCVGRREIEPVKAYFDVIHQELTKEKGEKSKQVKLCCRSMGITWKWVDHSRWDSYLPYIRDYGDRDAGDLMMSAFMLQAVREQELNEERFMTVLDCVECGTAGEERPPAYILALYLAFICVHQYASIEPPLKAVYDQLYRISWGEFTPPPSKMAYFEDLLVTMILCYGEAYTYNSADFAVRCSLEKLMPHYIGLLKMIPCTKNAVCKCQQKGDD